MCVQSGIDLHASQQFMLVWLKFNPVFESLSSRNTVCYSSRNTARWRVTIFTSIELGLLEYYVAYMSFEIHVVWMIWFLQKSIWWLINPKLTQRYAWIRGHLRRQQEYFSTLSFSCRSILDYLHTIFESCLSKFMGDMPLCKIVHGLDDLFLQKSTTLSFFISARWPFWFNLFSSCGGYL